jgi:hypothetical protein
MPHAFSVEIHDYISRKILSAKERKNTAEIEENRADQLFCEGELLELGVMRKYLEENIDLKTQTYF